MEEFTKDSGYDKPAKGGERDSTDSLRVGIRACLSSLYPSPHWQCFQPVCSFLLFCQLFPLYLLCWHTHTHSGYHSRLLKTTFWTEGGIWCAEFCIRVTPPNDGSLQIGKKWLQMLWNRATPAISTCSLCVERTRGSWQESRAVKG